MKKLQSWFWLAYIHTHVAVTMWRLDRVIKRILTMPVPEAMDMIVLGREQLKQRPESDVTRAYGELFDRLELRVKSRK